MTLTGKSLAEFEGRRAVTRKTLSESPKTSGQLMEALAKKFTQPSRPGYSNEGPMLKARCPRLAGRTHVIGNTVFPFDKHGICRIPDAGNNRLDYEVLLQQNGVTPWEDPVATEGALPAPAPEPAAPPAVIELPPPEVPAHAEMEAAPPDLVVPETEPEITEEKTEEPPKAEAKVEENTRRKPKKA